MQGKLIIVSAPSGAGKTSLVKHLLINQPLLNFSISATNRPKRDNETDGKDYYFLSTEEFMAKISQSEFLEWEEVYQQQYYGTLKSEVDRIWNEGNHVIFDVDVKGGLNIKRYFGSKALSIFIQPPSLEILKQRLCGRGTESTESIVKRIDKAEYELSFANQFDVILINDNLCKAQNDIVNLVNGFLQQ